MITTERSLRIRMINNIRYANMRIREYRSYEGNVNTLMEQFFEGRKSVALDALTFLRHRRQL